MRTICWPASQSKNPMTDVTRESLAAALSDLDYEWDRWDDGEDAHGNGIPPEHSFKVPPPIKRFIKQLRALPSPAPEPPPGEDDLERLAAIEHEQWVTWSKEVARDIQDRSRLERWAEFWVPYAALDEATKEHDRHWARKVLAAIGRAAQPAPDPEATRLLRLIVERVDKVHETKRPPYRYLVPWDLI